MHLPYLEHQDIAQQGHLDYDKCLADGQGVGIDAKTNDGDNCLLAQGVRKLTVIQLGHNYGAVKPLRHPDLQLEVVKNPENPKSFNPQDHKEDKEEVPVGAIM